MWESPRKAPQEEGKAPRVPEGMSSQDPQLGLIKETFQVRLLVAAPQLMMAWHG
jgi:hypothetical protein